MGRRSQKSRLKGISETLLVADLRLRVGGDITSPEDAKQTAIVELELARRKLLDVIQDVTKGTYP
jgi:hypothetical protein